MEVKRKQLHQQWWFWVAFGLIVATGLVWAGKSWYEFIATPQGKAWLAENDKRVAEADRQKAFDGLVSPADGSVYLVKKAIKKMLNDPDSYRSDSWSKLTKVSDTEYTGWNSFRAKNELGAYVRGEFSFTLSYSHDRWMVTSLK